MTADTSTEVEVGSPAPAGEKVARSGLLRWLIMGLGTVGVVLAVNQQFLLDIGGFQPLGNAYLYYLIGIFLAVSFLALPISRALDGRLLWVNLILAPSRWQVRAGWAGTGWRSSRRVGNTTHRRPRTSWPAS